MTLVVEATVLVAALVDSGPEGRWAESALAEGPLLAPELLPADVTDILRRLQRAGEISRVEANGARGSLSGLDVELAPFAPFSGRVWALRADIDTYDAWYVALAEAFDCPLVTLDRSLLHASGPECEIVVPHADDAMRLRLLDRPRADATRPPPGAPGPARPRRGGA